MSTEVVEQTEITTDGGNEQEHQDNIPKSLILDDIQLMAQVKKGDKDAFRKIIQNHEVPLLNFFRRLGANTDRAEECVQETFIKVFNYRKKYKPTHKFTTFLYTLAKHSWADECRRQKRHESRVMRYASDTYDAGYTTQDRLDIQEAIDRLSDKLRITMVLSVYQGLNYEEIAEVLKIPIGTVKSRMSMAFEQLREILKDD